MNVIGITYRAEKVTKDPEKYGLPTVSLKRNGGIAGWLEITGPGADEICVGDLVVIEKVLPEGVK